MSTRIAVVDDNPDFVNILSDILALQEGMEVAGTAANGLDAVELIQKEKPQIVILDIIMPLLGGIGVIEKINSLQMQDPPRFIILSAAGQYDIVQIALSLGASYFIMKPFDSAELIFVIHKLIKLNQSFLKEKSSCADEQNIIDLFNKIGVPAHLKGYDYLLKSVRIILEDPSAVKALKRKVYMTVAEQFDSTPERVERTIRNAIELTWNRGDIRLLTDVFGSEITDEKPWPSNSEFLIKASALFLERKKEIIL